MGRPAELGIAREMRRVRAALAEALAHEPSPATRLMVAVAVRCVETLPRPGERQPATLTD